MHRALASLFVLILSSILSSATLWAHEGSTHVLGTVTAVEAGHVVVQTLDKKTVTIKTTDRTRYRTTKEASTREALLVGHRVVAEVTQDETGLTASEVRFSAVAPKPGAPGAAGVPGVR